jgi:catechol 2,3-dioxygenase-like lactoylglutathione lyase family enzyme
VSGAPHLRVARPTARLEELVRMYTEGLGLELLGSFEGHAGFDGAMLGRPGAGWHLELTREAGAAPPGEPDPDALLVLYLPERAEWAAACARAEAAGFVHVASHNPYWDERGRTLADPDGGRVVLQRAPWPPEERP